MYFIMLGIGIATIAFSIYCIIVLFRKKMLKNQPLLVVKYVFLALAPLIWSIGNTITDNKDRVSALVLFCLLCVSISALLADLRLNK